MMAVFVQGVLFLPCNVDALPLPAGTTAEACLVGWFPGGVLPTIGVVLVVVNTAGAGTCTSSVFVVEVVLMGGGMRGRGPWHVGVHNTSRGCGGAVSRSR
jgi:hypothetical protein